MKAKQDDVPQYIEWLRQGSLVQRTKSADTLGEIGDTRAVPALIDGLGDASTAVQYIAAKSLSQS